MYNYGFAAISTFLNKSALLDTLRPLAANEDWLFRISVKFYDGHIILTQVSDSFKFNRQVSHVKVSVWDTPPDRIVMGLGFLENSDNLKWK